jgi:hypothetical protein
VEQAGASAEPRFLSLWLPSFSDHFPSQVSGAILALSVLNKLNMHMDSLGKNLALNSLVHSSMPGDTVDSSSFAMGHSFLNSAHALDIYYITLLVDSHVCGQRNNSMFPKRPRKHVSGSSPLSLCVCHFGGLLEDGGSA